MKSFYYIIIGTILYISSSFYNRFIHHISDEIYIIICLIAIVLYIIGIILLKKEKK